jgi:hypothetical protein
MKEVTQDDDDNDYGEHSGDGSKKDKVSDVQCIIYCNKQCKDNIVQNLQN